MAKPHPILLGLLGVGLGRGLVVALWSGDRGERHGEPLTPAAEVARSDPPLLDFERPPETLQDARQEATGTPPAPDADGDQPSARQFLAQWYGDQWPEIEAKIEAAAPKLDLDMPYHFTPWEDVELEFQEQALAGTEGRDLVIANFLDWTDELKADWVRREFGLPKEHELTDADLADIGALVEPFQQEILAKATRFVDMQDFYVRQCWETGKYQKAPFTTMGLNPDMGFHARGLGGFGWSVNITLKREDYPDMVALESEIQDACERRSERVVGFLRKRFAR